MKLNAKHIGDNVKYIRKIANKSQEGFAEQIETSTRKVSNIERGVVIPSLQTVVNISKHFEYSINFIIGNNTKL